MKKLIISALLACAPLAAGAQAPAGVAEEQVDPSRLPAAEAVAGRLLPEGSYAQMIGGSMDQMTDVIMNGILEMELSTIAEMFTEEERAKVDPEVLAMSMRDLMEIADPHFFERQKIMTQVISAELMPVMARIEPQVRGALAVALARRFDAAGLAELERFFATPVGSAFAAQSLTIWMDPEMMAASAAAMPEMMKEMPAIVKKLDSATAHLPPEPKAEEMKAAIREIAHK